MDFELYLGVALVATVLGLSGLVLVRRLTWPTLLAGLTVIAGGMSVVIWRGVVAIAAFLVLVPVAAFAADGTTVPLGPGFGDVRPWIETVVLLLGGGALMWLAYLAHRYLGLSIDEKLRAALQSAMANGIHGALDRLQAGADATSIDVRSGMIADAIPYVRAFAAEAVKRFGLTPEDLAELLKPQLNKILPPAVPVAADPSAT